MPSTAAPPPVTPTARPPIVAPDPGRRLPPGRLALLLALSLVLAAGAFVRFYPTSGYQLVGYDERLYCRYVDQLGKYGGPLAYPDIVEAYIAYQGSRPEPMLPPTRALFILSGWSWRSLFGGGAFDALRHVSALAGVGTMLVAAGFARRLGGPGWAVAAMALVGAAPLSIHLGQRALIDGFFAFWAMLALWALWECLQAGSTIERPSRRWLWIYGAGLLGMGLTKESALFVYAGLFGLLVLNLWARFGRADRPLWVMTFGAPVIALCLLTLICGGWEPLRGAFHAFGHPLPDPTLRGPGYSYLVGHGPWSRYLVDWVILCPALVVLAIGGLLRGRPYDEGATPGAGTSLRALLFLGVFVLITYAALSQLPGGMNLRHTSIWDLPLRLLALAQLTALSREFSVRQHLALALGVVGLCALDLTAYHRFFIEARIYDPTPEPLLQALEILRH